MLSEYQTLDMGPNTCKRVSAKQVVLDPRLNELKCIKPFGTVPRTEVLQLRLPLLVQPPGPVQLSEVESSLSEVPFVLPSGFSRTGPWSVTTGPSCSSSRLRLWEFPGVRIPERGILRKRKLCSRTNRVWSVSSFGISLAPASAPSLLPVGFHGSR